MVLSPYQARRFYDRFGAKQDSQAFYEDAALDDLIAHAQFDQAEIIFEFGCGTGRLASLLLVKHLWPSARYFGIDISQTMINIARQRLSPYEKRAHVALSGDSITFPLRDNSVDRVVSTYVLDLLSEADIFQVLYEAHRVITPTGKLCLVSLTNSKTLISRVVSGLWSILFRLYAPIVGGCRPIQLKMFMEPRLWVLEYCNTVTQFGVSSEVLVARPLLNNQ